jgi:Bacterial DNA-binding protein
VQSDACYTLRRIVVILLLISSLSTWLTQVGFGTFSVMARAARKGRNPRTGQEIVLPARKTPKFRAGKGLREVIKALQTFYVKPFMGET